MGLCESCAKFIRVNFKNGSSVSRCRVLDKDIRSSAIQCRSYVMRNSISIDDMYRMAWILSKTRQPGFMTSEATFKQPNPELANMPTIVTEGSAATAKG